MHIVLKVKPNTNKINFLTSTLVYQYTDLNDNMENPRIILTTVSSKIPSSKQLMAFSINIQCILNKCNELSIFLRKNGIEFLYIFEHCQDPNINMINVSNCTLVSHFYRSRRDLQCGVAIYVIGISTLYPQI